MLGYLPRQPPANDTSHLQRLWAGNQAHSSVFKGAAERAVNNHYYPTHGQTTVPMYETAGSTSGMDQLRAWQMAANNDNFVEGQHNLVKGHPMVLCRQRTRPYANGLTRTLTSPVNGATIDLAQLRYMPQEPSHVQIRQAMALGASHASDRRNYGDQFYWRANGQSFRHQN